MPMDQHLLHPYLVLSVHMFERVAMMQQPAVSDQMSNQFPVNGVVFDAGWVSSIYLALTSFLLKEWREEERP